MNFPDGFLLKDGIVVSKKGAYNNIAVYRCICGREQTAICLPYCNKGIGIKGAEYFGWRKINNKWECPYCTGNVVNLNNFFKGN